MEKKREKEKKKTVRLLRAMEEIRRENIFSYLKSILKYCTLRNKNSVLLNIQYIPLGTQ